MAITDRSLKGSFSVAAMTGMISSRTVFSGTIDLGNGSSVTDYNILDNKPRINGVELTSDRSLEELGFEEMTEADMYNLLDRIWKELYFWQTKRSDFPQRALFPHLSHT